AICKLKGYRTGPQNGYVDKILGHLRCEGERRRLWASPDRRTGILQRLPGSLRASPDLRVLVKHIPPASPGGTWFQSAGGNVHPIFSGRLRGKQCVREALRKHRKWQLRNGNT